MMKNKKEMKDALCIDKLAKLDLSKAEKELGSEPKKK